MSGRIKAQEIKAQEIKAQERAPRGTKAQDTNTPGIKVWGAPEGWDAFLLAQRRREHPGNVVHVARDDARMARLAEALAFVMPEAEILRFPAWDCLPYDRVSPNPALVSERIATLARLPEQPLGPRIVLTTVNALVQRVPPRSAFSGSSMDLAINGQVAWEQSSGGIPDQPGYIGIACEGPKIDIAQVWVMPPPGRRSDGGRLFITAARVGEANIPNEMPVSSSTSANTG